MVNKILLKKIKNARKLKDYSQKDMAERLHVSIPTYSRFECGLTKTNLNLMLEVCKILDIDFNSLVDNEFIEMNDVETVQNLSNTKDIKKQVAVLVKLLEKQQRVNEILLKKLKSFHPQEF